MKSLIVLNVDSEGEFTLKKAQCLKLTKVRIFLNTLVSFISGGIWAIILIAFQNCRIMFLFEASSDMNDTTHLLLTNKDKTKDLQKKLEFMDDGKQRFYVKNKLLNYVIDGDYKTITSCQISAVEFLSEKVSFNQLLSLQQNQQDQVEKLYTLYGKALMVIPIPTLLIFLAGVIFKPLQLLLYISCIVWTLEGEIRSALVTIFITYSCFILTFYFNQKAMKNINKMSILDLTVKCFRKQGSESIELKIKYEDLLPGDVFEVQNNYTIPVDCVLVRGELVMNEGMLTGESVPITKHELPQTDQEFNINSCNNHIVFQGTKVLQLKSNENLAMVLRTSFSSLKGQLVRTLVFPIIQEDNFMLRFFQLIFFVVLYFYLMHIPAFIHMYNSEYKLQDIVFRCLDIIIWCVTPYFPFFFSIIQSICLVRLRNKKILGLYPDKLAIAGKVQVCCFDKTGTLTTNGMQVKHLMRNQATFGEVSVKEDQDQVLFQIMGTCHNIIMYEGEYMGDILDIEMLKFSGYDLDQKEVEIEHVFEFESKFQRMSVIAKSSEQYYVFAKGSPEKILELADLTSIPQNYTEILEQQAIKGYRVIALAHKKIEDPKISRDQAEQNLIFDGFIMFLNPLKEDTPQIIQKLNEANLDTKIISGDNVNTCIETAIQANILNEDEPIMILDYLKDQQVIQLTGLKNGIILFKDQIVADDFEGSINDLARRKNTILRSLFKQNIRSKR